MLLVSSFIRQITSFQSTTALLIFEVFFIQSYHCISIILLSQPCCLFIQFIVLAAHLCNVFVKSVIFRLIDHVHKLYLSMILLLTLSYEIISNSTLLCVYLKKIKFWLLYIWKSSDTIGCFFSFMKWSVCVFLLL